MGTEKSSPKHQHQHHQQQKDGIETHTHTRKEFEEEEDAPRGTESDLRSWIFETRVDVVFVVVAFARRERRHGGRIEKGVVLARGLFERWSIIGIIIIIIIIEQNDQRRRRRKREHRWRRRRKGGRKRTALLVHLVLVKCTEEKENGEEEG